MKSHTDSHSRLAALLLAILPVAPLLVSAGEPSRPAGKPVSDSLRPFVNNHTLAGAVVLVASKDEVLCLEAVGFSDLEAQTLMGTDNLFWVASMSKPITAAGLMMLVDEGKVGLDDPVEKYLPEFKGQWLAVEQDRDHVLLKHPKRAVTVRDLLRHTSGMPFSSAMERPTLDLLPLRDAVRSYAMTPLQYEPGTRYQYSNAGINTAGRIIEVVGGMPYEDFLQKRLFGPLGMKDTTFWPDEKQLRRLAKSYRPNAANNSLVETSITQLKYPLNDRTRQPVPAGGLFSTAGDLGRFCRMILSGGVLERKRYLSEPAVKEMTSKQTGAGIRESYGLGWSTGGDTFGHGGAYATNMTIDSKRGLITVFLVQHAGFPGDGGKSHAAFQKAAVERFGKPRDEIRKKSAGPSGGQFGAVGPRYLQVSAG
jgi:CubicO group peptidase (beta-lactamase class C family)